MTNHDTFDILHIDRKKRNALPLKARQLPGSGSYKIISGFYQSRSGKYKATSGSYQAKDSKGSSSTIYKSIRINNMQPIVIRIDKEIRPSNSSFGTWQVTYYIKWHVQDKSEIGTYVYFYSKKKAIQWILDNEKKIHKNTGQNFIRKEDK